MAPPADISIKPAPNRLLAAASKQLQDAWCEAIDRASLLCAEDVDAGSADVVKPPEAPWEAQSVSVVLGDPSEPAMTVNVVCPTDRCYQSWVVALQGIVSWAICVCMCCRVALTATRCCVPRVKAPTILSKTSWLCISVP